MSAGWIIGLVLTAIAIASGWLTWRLIGTMPGQHAEPFDWRERILRRPRVPNQAVPGPVRDDLLWTQMQIDRADLILRSVTP